MTTLKEAVLGRFIRGICEAKDQQDLEDARMPEKRRKDVSNGSPAGVFKDALLCLTSWQGRV